LKNTSQPSQRIFAQKFSVENVPTLHGAESVLSEPKEHMLSVASVPESFRIFLRLCFPPKKDRCPFVEESAELGDWDCLLLFFIRVHTIVEKKE
jgi:hypothetical protein